MSESDPLHAAEKALRLGRVGTETLRLQQALLHRIAMVKAALLERHQLALLVAVIPRLPYPHQQVHQIRQRHLPHVLEEVTLF